ncbi:GtrA family protein [Desulfobulbus elongatus]|uniref:GtrA family protein n=1 Tax=Desulfobulbus elongatus TaxID=53332 RepID=UPI00068583F0|nr:GtrA family protein [Desulfobulbus elongatus]
MSGRTRHAAVSAGDRALLRQLGRFSLVGVAGFVVNAGLVEILVGFVGPVWAQGIAFPAAATATWWMNRRYTFGASNLAVHREWLRYVLANSLGWLLNNGTYLLLVFIFPAAAVHPALAVAGGSLAGLSANFVLSRRMVFRKTGDADQPT